MALLCDNDRWPDEPALLGERPDYAHSSVLDAVITGHPFLDGALDREGRYVVQRNLAVQALLVAGFESDDADRIAVAGVSRYANSPEDIGREPRLLGAGFKAAKPKHESNQQD